VFGCKCQVLIDIALRINDNCRTRRLVSDHIRSVRQARQVELLEDHAGHLQQQLV
jgi:hypothetical protein